MNFNDLSFDFDGAREKEIIQAFEYDSTKLCIIYDVNDEEGDKILEKNI